MEEKIKISVPSSIYETLIKDCVDFKIVHASVFVLAIEFKVRNKMGFYQISNER